MSSRLLFLGLAIAVYLTGCNTGSETGNPTKSLSGNIRTMDGLAAARTQIILVPEDFNPLGQISGGNNALRYDTTDAQGRYQFTGVDSGRYNLEALSLTDGTCARIKGISISRFEKRLTDQRLSTSGKIEAVLIGALDTLTGYAYIPGSTFFKRVKSSSGKVSLDSIPPGKIDSVIYGNLQNTADKKAFAWNLEVLPGASVPTTGPYLAWKHSSSVLLNTTSTGAAIKEMVTHIPLRISLSAPDFDFATASVNGSDIRVTNEKGQPLPCEIQLWDAASGSAQIWVRVDTVFADSLQKLRLFWGYSGTKIPPPTWPANSIFNTADGYAAAWHLDEDPFLKGGGELRGNTTAINNAIAIGYPAVGGSVPGVIGRGLNFDGKTQFLGSQALFTNPSVFTFAGWFKTNSISGGRLFDFTDKDTTLDQNYWDRFIQMYPDGTLHYGVYQPTISGTPMPTSGTYKIQNSVTALNDGQWHHVAARLSNAGQAFFIDGIKVADDPTSTEAEIINGYWRMGFGKISSWAPAGTNQYFEGIIDEVWIAHSYRSDAFIKLTFENQKPGSQFLKFQ